MKIKSLNTQVRLTHHRRLFLAKVKAAPTRLALLATLTVLVSLLAGAQMALAQSTTNPAPVQLFYVPFPEDQLLRGCRRSRLAVRHRPTNPVQTYISIAAVANSTIIYYDQWENGYDADIANPLNIYSAGNPGGTQIWGDGNTANGARSGRSRATMSSMRER